MDLDLIDAAEKGDSKACFELIKKGASPFIDPIDYTNNSAIIDMLESAISFHTSLLVNYKSNKDDFISWVAYDMLTSFYCLGASRYILDKKVVALAHNYAPATTYTHEKANGLIVIPKSSFVRTTSLSPLFVSKQKQQQS